MSSKYSRLEYLNKNKKIKHIVVVGDCDVESYEAFLEELYNEDHGIIDYNTVIMQSKPNDQLTKLVNNHKHRDKITFSSTIRYVYRQI